MIHNHLALQIRLENIFQKIKKHKCIYESRLKWAINTTCAPKREICSKVCWGLHRYEHCNFKEIGASYWLCIFITFLTRSSCPWCSAWAGKCIVTICTRPTITTGVCATIINILWAVIPSKSCIADTQQLPSGCLHTFTLTATCWCLTYRI